MFAFAFLILVILFPGVFRRILAILFILGFVAYYLGS